MVYLYGKLINKDIIYNKNNIQAYIHSCSFPEKFSFFEGDIVLDKDMEDRMKGKIRSPRSVVRPISRLWKYGIVPYIIDQSLSQSTHLIYQ